MANKLIVAPAPHVHGSESTQKIMPGRSAGADARAGVFGGGVRLERPGGDLYFGGQLRAVRIPDSEISA